MTNLLPALILAIASVESGGDWKANSVGEHGDIQRGGMQCKNIWLNDFSRIMAESKSVFRLHVADCYKPAVMKWAAAIWFGHYEIAFLAKHRRAATDMEKVFWWRFGYEAVPDAHAGPKYWQKIQDAMAKNKETK